MTPFEPDVSPKTTAVQNEGRSELNSRGKTPAIYAPRMIWATLVSISYGATSPCSNANCLMVGGGAPRLVVSKILNRVETGVTAVLRCSLSPQMPGLDRGGVSRRHPVPASARRFVAVDASRAVRL
jgi:hypothetical protein